MINSLPLISPQDAARFIPALLPVVRRRIIGFYLFICREYRNIVSTWDYKQVIMEMEMLH